MQQDNGLKHTAYTTKDFIKVENREGFRPGQINHWTLTQLHTSWRRAGREKHIRSKNNWMKSKCDIFHQTETINYNVPKIPNAATALKKSQF